MAVTIDGNTLTLEQIERVTLRLEEVAVHAGAVERIGHSRSVLEEITSGQEAFYGINTGFGAMADRTIDRPHLRQLQINLIRSHTTGVGPPFSEEVTRAIVLLRANVLAKGFSGVRLVVVQRLLDMLNLRITPVIPCKGSVGASGDLAPLAHLALALIGEGDVIYEGEQRRAGEVFKDLDLESIELLEKEGLALINGTQMMTALAVLNLLEAERLMRLADLTGAIAFEAQLGNISPFAARIQNVRPHPGQAVSARNILTIIQDSPLWNSHKGRNKIQDAYSIRCMPQVHGAIRDTLAHIRGVLETEVNAATENPLIFSDPPEIVSGGNFHGEPVAFVMDFLSIALTELGNISERRIDRLLNPASNMGLPPFLIKENGLNSGFMMAHVTATALTSENRTLAHPSSVDNIPTSANQEDHVSMGSIAARTAREILSNVKYILAIELIIGLQALEFYHEKSSPLIESVRQLVREKVPFLEQDARLDICFNRVVQLLNSGSLTRLLEERIE